MKQARGEDRGANRMLRQLRADGEEWTEYRNGIICKTPRNAAGKRATTIWYGAHRVSWEMIRTRPKVPTVRTPKPVKARAEKTK